MIALDTTALSLLFVPNAKSSTKDGAQIKHAKERMDLLVERIAREQDAILIPTPSLSEVLIKLEPVKIDELLKRLKASPWFRVESFDSAAAVELASRTAKAIQAKDKWEGLKADHTKIKFDRQIVSVAIVNGATEIISDDEDVDAIGKRWGIQVTSVKDLPLPAAFIPPPIYQFLENDETQKAQSEPTQVRGSSVGLPEGEAGTKALSASVRQDTEGEKS